MHDWPDVGCGSGSFLPGTNTWSEVKPGWGSAEHRTGSPMRCGCSASPAETGDRTLRAGRFKRSGPDGLQPGLTSKIILCSPKQKVEPKGLVLLADEDLRSTNTSLLQKRMKESHGHKQPRYLWSTTGFSIG